MTTIRERLSLIEMELKYLKKVMYIIGGITLANFGVGNIEYIYMILRGLI